MNLFNLINILFFNLYCILYFDGRGGECFCGSVVSLNTIDFGMLYFDSLVYFSNW